MSNDQSSTSDQTGSANQSDSDTKVDSEKDLVPKSAYEGVKNDLHKWKQRAKEHESQLKEVNEKLAKLSSDADGNDHKTLAERYKKEAAEQKARADKLNEGYIYGEKHRTVYSELKKLGLKDEAERYLEYEDLKDLEVETTSKGRVNVLGAKEWASDFFSKNKFLFESKKAAGVNSTDGRGTGGSSSDKVTPADVVAAERQAKKTNKPEDVLAYKEILNKYQKQKQRSA